MLDVCALVMGGSLVDYPLPCADKPEEKLDSRVMLLDSQHLSKHRLDSRAIFWRQNNREAAKLFILKDKTAPLTWCFTCAALLERPEE